MLREYVSHRPQRLAQLLLSLTIAVVATACHQQTPPHSKAQPAPALSGSQSPVIPEPSSWSFPDVVASARVNAPTNHEGRKFDKHGLAYTLRELDAVPIATMSAQELQKYADIVTNAYPDAVFRQAGADYKNLATERINTTAVANVAYVSLHAVDSDMRKLAAGCLEELQTRLNNRPTAP